MIHKLGQKLTFAGAQKQCNFLKTSPELKLHVIFTTLV